MVAIYVGSLLFGGVLIAASLLSGVGHGADVHVGDAGGGHGGSDSTGDGHGPGSAYAWLSLFGLRFWSFAATFFGLTGLVVRWVGGAAALGLAPVISAGVGVAAGVGASSVFRALSRESVGQVSAAGALVGREGRLLLPVGRTQRGKVRLALPAGGYTDLLAETSGGGDDEALAAGADVMIVEVRGNVAIVTRAPASLPPGEPRSLSETSKEKK